MERDRFLRVLEREWERDRERRDLRERLVERFLVSALGRKAAASASASAAEPMNEGEERVAPGSMAAAMVDWASRTLLITLSSSLAAACGVISGGFTMALLE